MDAPNYVQGQYTVAQRDAIFAKAAKYPDASDGLQNQVPTIFPDGTVGWRQIPEGGDGTANANIAVVESTQYASKDYSVGDLLIYNGQLSRVSAPIAAGGTITPGTNVVSTTVALWAPESFVPIVGKGRNLLDNAYFIGGGTPGTFPVNQRGNTTGTVSSEGFIDRWILSGSYNLYANSLWLSQGSFFSQKIDPALGAFLNGKMVTVSLLHADGTLDTGSAVYVASPSQNVNFFRGTRCYACLIDGNPNQIYFVQDADNIGVAAVKLELGDRQTLARNIGTDANPQWVLNDPPPDYRQELAKCQRYLQVFEGDAYAFLGTTYATSSTSIEPILPLLVPMSKKTGSILASTTAFLQTNGAWNQQVTIPAGSNNVRISSNTAAFTISLANGLLGTFPSMGAISSDGNTKIIISTE